MMWDREGSVAGSVADPDPISQKKQIRIRPLQLKKSITSRVADPCENYEQVTFCQTDMVFYRNSCRSKQLP